MVGLPEINTSHSLPPTTRHVSFLHPACYSLTPRAFWWLELGIKNEGSRSQEGPGPARMGRQPCAEASGWLGARPRLGLCQLRELDLGGRAKPGEGKAVGKGRALVSSQQLGESLRKASPC